MGGLFFLNFLWNKCHGYDIVCFNFHGINSMDMISFVFNFHGINSMATISVDPTDLINAGSKCRRHDRCCNAGF